MDTCFGLNTSSKDLGVILCHVGDCLPLCKAINQDMRQRFALDVEYTEISSNWDLLVCQQCTQVKSGDRKIIIILSKRFFETVWINPKAKKLIKDIFEERPSFIATVWYDVTKDDILKYSLCLAEVEGISADKYSIPADCSDLSHDIYKLLEGSEQPEVNIDVSSLSSQISGLKILGTQTGDIFPEIQESIVAGQRSHLQVDLDLLDPQSSDPDIEPNGANAPGSTSTTTPGNQSVPASAPITAPNSANTPASTSATTLGNQSLPASAPITAPNSANAPGSTSAAIPGNQSVPASAPITTPAVSQSSPGVYPLQDTEVPRSHRSPSQPSDVPAIPQRISQLPWDFINELATRLDVDIRTVKNWRHLASYLGHDRHIDSFELAYKASGSPTRQLIQKEISTNDCSIDHLKNILRKMERNDLLKLFAEYNL